MELKLTSLGSGTSGKISLSEDIFNHSFNEALIHQVVCAYLANGRSATKGLKNRSAVRGGGIKPWRQKGTGRARAGTIRSPLFRGGGVTFGSSQPNYDQKVNKKMYRGAIRSILSELLRQERLKVVSALELSAPKTKALATLLEQAGCSNVLIVLHEEDQNVMLSARNLPNVGVVLVHQVNPVNLVRYHHVLTTKAALEALQERL